MKKVLVAFILLTSSLIGISEASAVTCPSGTVVSSTDSTKCIASPGTKNATDKTTVYTCANGVFNTSTNKCDIPGGWVEPTTYTSTTTHTVSTCSSGSLGADGYCHVTLNPPITNVQYSPANDCSGSYFYSAGECHLISKYTTTKPADIYPSCPTGYTRSGDNCIKTIYEILDAPTQTVDGYYCGGVLQTSSLCTVAGYYSPSSTADPVITFSGTCPTYYTFQKTDGICYAYVFAPETPTLLTVYKCTETQWNTVPRTTYYNYDASIISPFGVSRSCLVSTSSPVIANEGIYLCTSVNIVTNNTFFYVSDTDATSSTTTVITQCDFVSTEGSLSDEVEDVIVLSSNDCQNLQYFNEYLACLASKYV